VTLKFVGTGSWSFVSMWKWLTVALYCCEMQALLKSLNSEVQLNFLMSCIHRKSGHYRASFVALASYLQQLEQPSAYSCLFCAGFSSSDQGTEPTLH